MDHFDNNINNVSSPKKAAIYDWGHNNSVPKRILPTTPPAPSWCWGPLDVVLQEAEEFKIKSEEDSEKEQIRAEENEDECCDYIIEESCDTGKILEYNHGTKRQFLINPLFKKSDANPKSEDMKHQEYQDSDAVRVANNLPIVPPSFEQDLPPPSEEKTSLKEVKISPSKNSSPCSSSTGSQMPLLHNGDPVKNEMKVKDLRSIKKVFKSSTSQIGRRKVIPQKDPSGLDSLIGQKLNKARTSARDYAKPPKMMKSIEEATTKEEQISDNKKDIRV